MAEYSTGEAAKICSVTVRTVQYYDNCGLLNAKKTGSGQKRVYTDDDIEKLKTVCYLREIGMSVKDIVRLFEENNSAKIIDIFVNQTEAEIRNEIDICNKKLEKITELKQYLGKYDIPICKLGDTVKKMKIKEQIEELRIPAARTAIAFIVALPTFIVYWIKTGIWWPLAAVYIPLAVSGIIFFALYCYNKIVYTCPECGHTFKPTFINYIRTRHSHITRSLKCPECEYIGPCVETVTEKNARTKKIPVLISYSAVLIAIIIWILPLIKQNKKPTGIKNPVSATYESVRREKINMCFDSDNIQCEFDTSIKDICDVC